MDDREKVKITNGKQNEKDQNSVKTFVKKPGGFEKKGNATQKWVCQQCETN